MVLRTAFADPGLAFLIGSKDRADWEGVSRHLESGGEVFDHENLSYIGLDGWQYTAARLEGMSSIPDPAQLRDLQIPTTEYVLPRTPFGAHIVMAIEGPLACHADSPPDSFVAWGSPTGGQLTHAQIEGEAIPPNKMVFALRTPLHGVLVSQTYGLGSTIRSTVLFVRLQLNAPVGSVAAMNLGVAVVKSRRPRAQEALRLPAIPYRWALVAERALMGYRQHCKPFQPPQDEMAGLRQKLSEFEAWVPSCTTADIALGKASSADEFRAALTYWAAKANSGTLYKRMRRLAEGYMPKVEDPLRRHQVADWWNELRMELAPPQ